ncbi:hypothetical protein [Tannockella kyphosi]|uniref:hypothetical protein n=1 Tax=Tannockella kyphosi TaxID=2899121 RepID=UPI0020111B42|nr:hypothetical protein [Tannockella kyphosi]
MTNKIALDSIYKQNLEQDIISFLAKKKNIDIRKAMDVYYNSKLSKQISNNECGIENLDAKYLVEDLMENESELFIN